VSVMSFEIKMRDEQHGSYTIARQVATSSCHNQHDRLVQLVQTNARRLRQRLRPAWFVVPTPSYHHTAPIDASLVNDYYSRLQRDVTNPLTRLNSEVSKPTPLGNRQPTHRLSFETLFREARGMTRSIKRKR